jgi:hypothetical protein
MRTIILAAAIALTAAPAFAQTVWTAKPVESSNASGFVGASVMWSCGASGCQSKSDTAGAVAQSECRGLAKQVGPLSSFVATMGPFDVAQLAECNKAARRPGR